MRFTFANASTRTIPCKSPLLNVALGVLEEEINSGDKFDENGTNKLI